MKPRSMTPMGSLHPVLFFAGIYVVALLFSIFICSTLFYSCNASSANPTGQQPIPPAGIQTSGNPVASR
ncbi:MAG TPA: hypothetical protein PLO99_06705 [Chitinophagaceae bacterium]|nr:hypothetical protein [Chitinophagaceae bacterium]HRG92108.1 hypothetical protein [Chitinophagaceae bacterium]